MDLFRKFFILSLALTGCVSWCETSRQDLTPLEVLERYIEVSTSMTDVEQKQILLSYTAGNLRASIEGATDQAIRKAFIDRKYALDSFSLVSQRDRTPRETEITFYISYRDHHDIGEGEEPALVSLTNTVTLFRENDMWSITDVHGAKDTEIHFGVTKDSQITPN